MGKEITKEDLKLQLQAQAFRANSGIRYSYEFKKMVVKNVLEEHLSVPQLSKHMGIPRKTIYSWILNFSGESKSKEKDTVVSKSIQHYMPMPKMPEKIQNPPETPEDELARLRAENKRLEDALKMSELANHAKDVMIDIAEKTFNIPIRKKSGAKQ